MAHHRRLFHLVLLALLALGVAGSALAAPRAATTGDPTAVPAAEVRALQEAITQGLVAADPTTDGGVAEILGIEREEIAPGIAHYSYRLRTGPGPYDFIGLHRVTRERRPGVAAPSRHGFFYQHGSAKDFRGMMLPGTLSPSAPDDFGMGAYLARNGVDVWGIDQGWCLIPADQTDATPFAGWGMDRAVRDLRIGMIVARTVRALTGGGLGRLILAGYSSAVLTTGALLNAETQVPAPFRQAGAWIPIDSEFRTTSPERLEADIANLRAQLDAGEYLSAVIFKPIGELARTLPDEESPFLPGFTNLQAMLFLSAFPGVVGPAPFHFWAGNFDESGFPSDLRLTPLPAALDFLETAIAWEPTRWVLDTYLITAGVESAEFDGHLSEVAVPILGVASGGGGLAPDMGYSNTLFGSTDKQVLVVSDGSPAEIDVGHIDLFTWPGAEQAMWRPVLDWILAHPMGAGSGRVADWFEGEEQPVAAAPTVARDRLAVSPNPARGAFTVSFALATGGAAQLDLLDVSGRRVRSLDLGGFGPGTHRVSVDGLGTLVPGVYLVRVADADGMRTQRVAVVR